MVVVPWVVVVGFAVVVVGFAVVVVGLAVVLVGCAVVVVRMAVGAGLSTVSDDSSAIVVVGPAVDETSCPVAEGVRFVCGAGGVAAR